MKQSNTKNGLTNKENKEEKKRQNIDKNGFVTRYYGSFFEFIFVFLHFYTFELQVAVCCDEVNRDHATQRNQLFKFHKIFEWPSNYRNPYKLMI